MVERVELLVDAFVDQVVAMQIHVFCVEAVVGTRDKHLNQILEYERPN